jgi:AraC-like DNA-binding protein
LIVYQEYKAVNFLKNYIYSFIYLKSRVENESILFYPDGADYFIYCGDTLQIITKEQIKEPYNFTLKKDIEYFIVRFKPFSFYFLKEDEDKFQQTLALVQQMFKSTKTFPQKKKLIELFIIELTNLSSIHNRVVDICNKVIQTKGDISTYALAKSSGLNIRTLQRDFRKITQLTPKEFINIIKFQNTITVLYGKINHFKIVKIDPYYDYSHFYKNFKKYLNVSPKEFKIGKNIYIKSIFDI